MCYKRLLWHLLLYRTGKKIHIKEVRKLSKTNGFGNKREDIIFFITMSDSDYVDEMLKESVKTFNSSETLKRYEINIDY